MKIGIIGAPGSGKTLLSYRLSTHFNDKYETVVTIADDFQHDVEERLDIAVGRYASYVADIAICLDRYGIERNSVTDHSIACGTLIDSATYTAIGLQIDQTQYSWATANVVMQFYSLLAASLLDYDVLVRTVNTGDDTFSTVFDASLDGSIEAFGHADDAIVYDGSDETFALITNAIAEKI